MKKRLSVGRIVVHNLLLQVFLVPGDGGSCEFGNYRRYSLGEMLLGADCDWHFLVKTFVHELLEVSLFMNSAAYSPQRPLDGNSSGRFVFMCNHEVLNDVSVDLGDVIAAVLPTLARAYKAWRRQRERPEKKRRKKPGKGSVSGKRE